MSATTPAPRITRDDLVSDQEVRWCPGCGDYAILSQVQRVMPEFGVPREQIVFISGIGCSSRFPYYMNTYGFHTIHGRAPTFATGLRCTRPELSVWVVTGDGDGLSIGGNHLLHAMRRNADIKILLFNNQIYGLTKGQYSPTSPQGLVTKSSPMGSVDYPLHPLSVALAAEASFLARTVDVDAAHFGEVLRRAAAHRGTAFIEILQNCPIYNDGAWDPVTQKATRDDRQLHLEQGKPMRFGPGGTKGIRVRGVVPEVVDVGPGGVPESEILVHDERAEPAHAFLLSRMEHPQFPVPLGVFRAVERPLYETILQAQVDEARRKQGEGDLMKVLHGSSTWTVAPPGAGRP